MLIILSMYISVYMYVLFMSFCKLYGIYGCMISDESIFGSVLWFKVFKQAHILVLNSISVVVMSELSESRSRKCELW